MEKLLPAANIMGFMMLLGKIAYWHKIVTKKKITQASSGKWIKEGHTFSLIMFFCVCVCWKWNFNSLLPLSRLLTLWIRRRNENADWCPFRLTCTSTRSVAHWTFWTGTRLTVKFEQRYSTVLFTTHSSIIHFSLAVLTFAWQSCTNTFLSSTPCRNHTSITLAHT